MKTKTNNTLGILLSILIGIFVFFVGINVQGEGEPRQVYQVYLNGKTIGLIESEGELLDLIDQRQQQIKEKYNVDKVYPPRGLEIKETYTYNNNIISAEEIYEIIQDKDPFTISGYTITIKYPEDQIIKDSEEIINRETVYINVLNKTDFEEAFKNVIKAFVGSESYELFASDNQPEIVETGSKIESIYWDENITIKENLINVDSEIFTNSNDISKYLLFGTLEEQEHYTVREGDDIPKITYNNNLSIEEFLVANPTILSEHVLLTPGKKVNIGLIKPMITIVSEMHVVEDIVNNFKIEYVDDKDSYVGTQKVIQEGSKGISRAIEKVLYRNGDVNNLVILPNPEILVPVVNQIISRGVKTYSNDGSWHYESAGNDAWSWPTISPFVITSGFKWRWGSHHNGIDISGTGHGSPIYAVSDGTVIVNTFTNDFGYYTVIKHDNGYLTLYAHLAQKARYSVGTAVKREQVIGYMGNTGRSTGTHLHFSVIKDTEFRYSNYVDPCASIFSC